MTEVMVNVGSPRLATRAAESPTAGVGLMRAEFLFYSLARHPATLIGTEAETTLHDVLSNGIREVAEAFAPRPVRYRTLDFKSNEMRSLVGGEQHEAEEGNPALGLRGCSRYRRDREILLAELRTIVELRAQGLDNLQVMFPFVRSAEELAFCRAALDEAGGDPDLNVWAMVEIPALVYVLADLAPHVNGVSVGTNDLAQLMLGVDRDNPEVAYLYDDGHPAVVSAACAMIATARELGLGTSVCGDRPSQDAAFVEALVAEQIDSISVPLDAVEETTRVVRAASTTPESER